MQCASIYLFNMPVCVCLCVCLTLDLELELLNKLDSFGLPVVKAQGPILVDGTPVLLFERFALGSKNVVRLDNKVITKVGSSPLLNQRSIDDLTSIRKTMIEKNIWVNDLQFLIGDDGRIVISDLLDVDLRGPSKNSLRMIKLLIEVAEENIK